MIVWQMITICAVLDSGALHGDSEAFQVAGPRVHLVAFDFVRVIAIYVMKGMCEMDLMFPAPLEVLERHNTLYRASIHLGLIHGDI